MGPMLPSPTTPSVLLQSSVPSHLLRPLARAHGRGGLRDAPRQREQHGDGVLGGGDVAAAGRVHHHDAALGGRVDVDVVDADAGAADDAQLVGPRDHVGGHLGGAADDERVVLADDAPSARPGSARAWRRSRDRAARAGARAPRRRGNRRGVLDTSSDQVSSPPDARAQAFGPPVAPHSPVVDSTRTPVVRRVEGSH